MGMITSDFYSRFGSIDIVEAPFTVGELMNLASDLPCPSGGPRFLYADLGVC